jgi:drug/metabolite transporter (DMT)-like permease
MRPFGRQDSSSDVLSAPFLRMPFLWMPFLWMTGSAILFACMNAAVREASLEATVPMVAAMRAFCGLMVALLYAKSQRQKLQINAPASMWLRSIFGTIAMAATFYTLSRQALPLGDASTLFNLSPVGVALLSPVMLKERISPVIVVSMALSILGITLIVKPAFVFGIAGPYPLGDAAWGMLAAASSAIAMVMLRRSKHEHPSAIAAHFSGLATLVFTTATLFSHGSISLRTLLFMVLAGVCAGVAQLMMTRAYAEDQAARVAAFGYIQVVASALLGAYFSHVWPTPMAALGMACVVSGGLFLVFAPRPQSASLAP